MKIDQTSDGRMKMTLDVDRDYAFLAELLQDAVDQGGVERIVDQIGVRGTDEDWAEFVKPDLVAQFKSEIMAVREAVTKAQESGATEVFIGPEEAQNWYSTLNQARLNLEVAHKLSELPEEMAEVPPEQYVNKFKYEYYTYIQSMLLEMVEF